jgi:hypothetical protein
VIAAFVFVSGVFVFVSDSGKTCGNKNDKACFRPFPFRFQPYGGVLALHEILHELKSKKLQALILKLDFEKAYDRVN